MRTVGPVRQVQSRHVERHAVEAISQRLGHHVADAVIGLTREAGGSVILHLNSGGNASAAESRLRALGYCVEPTDYDSYGPGRYGVKLRVSPGDSSSRWCVGSRTPPSVVRLDSPGSYANPRGICSHCGREMPVLGDATVRRHTVEGGPPVRRRSAAGALES